MYQKPSAERVQFANEDIVTTSGGIRHCFAGFVGLCDWGILHKSSTSSYTTLSDGSSDLEQW